MRNKGHRIFLAINFPEKIKKKFSQFQEEWFNWPVKLTPKENLHVTLLFIGNINTEEIFNLCRIVKKIVSKRETFEIKFNKICFGPVNKRPRMIWALGERNNELSFLRNRLEQGFFKVNESRVDNKGFCPHITLARIKQKEWEEMKERREASKDISISFLADSVEVMESVLSRKGPKYIVLESISLK